MQLETKRLRKMSGTEQKNESQFFKCTKKITVVSGAEHTRNGKVVGKTSWPLLQGRGGVTLASHNSKPSVCG